MENIEDSSDTEYENINSLEELVEAEKEMEVEEYESDSIKVGAWVIATYKTKKSVKHFVGKVLEEDDTSARVKFLRKKKDFFIWPEAEDLDTISKDDILNVLPPPTEGRRGKLIFSVKFDGLHVQ